MEEGVSAVNLSQHRIVVVVLAVLLCVVAGLVVSATQRASTHLDQNQEGSRSRPSTGSVPASVALLPGLATAGIAVVAILATDRRERERLKHERQLKLEELENQRHSRLRDERIRVYSEYLASWESYERARNTLYIGPDRTEVKEAQLQLLSSFNALSLLAPEEVRAAALGLREWSESDPKDRDPAAPGRYWKAARKDLGIPD